MKIGITINEVLRDFIGQFVYTYNKYKTEFNPEIDIEKTEIDTWDLLEFFKFSDEEEMNKFLYSEASLEIFGHADQLHPNVITKLNRFATEVWDEEEHEIIIVSREADKSIPSTLFFLSKLGFTVNNLRFVMDTAKKWDYVDVLITANPKALKTKPEGKISVKVNTTYNKGVEADYEIDSIVEIFDNEEEFNKILEL